ncbi:MAG: hypothetical protein IT349_05130 [Candidatus Eisenbacteria bacterium]|nr:hypothetical protein [Candidatus Eisenbacteria bacterium]
MRISPWWLLMLLFVADLGAEARVAGIPVGIDPLRLDPARAGGSGRDSLAEHFPAAPSPSAATFDSLGDLEATDWDSAFAAYDRNLAKARRGRVEPLPRFAYSKVQGVHLEMGLGYGPVLGLAERVEARFGYDLGRERPGGSALIRVGGADPLLPPEEGSLLFGAELEWHDRVRAFGDHDPYGNSLLALFGGYDARHYLRDRGGSLDLLLRRGAGQRIRLGAFRTEQAPLRVVEDWHLFGDDLWMSENFAARSLTANGLRLRVDRAPAFATPEQPDGLYLRGGVTWQARGARPDDPFSRTEFSLYHHGSFERGDGWAFALRASSATAGAPLQALASFGGDGGLHGVRPWTVVGRNLLYARGQYELSSARLRRTRLPVLAGLGLQVVPYTEAGAIGHALATVDHDPARLRWNLGVGLRKSLIETGQASHAQIDFAWPMGEDSGPARITLSFSNDGLD